MERRNLRSGKAGNPHWQILKQQGKNIYCIQILNKQCFIFYREDAKARSLLMLSDLASLRFHYLRNHE